VYRVGSREVKHSELTFLLVKDTNWGFIGEVNWKDKLKADELVSGRDLEHH
jgi:hypothetical protein